MTKTCIIRVILHNKSYIFCVTLCCVRYCMYFTLLLLSACWENAFEECWIGKTKDSVITRRVCNDRSRNTHRNIPPHLQKRPGKCPIIQETIKDGEFLASSEYLAWLKLHILIDINQVTLSLINVGRMVNDALQLVEHGSKYGYCDCYTNRTSWIHDNN